MSLSVMSAMWGKYFHWTKTPQSVPIRKHKFKLKDKHNTKLTRHALLQGVRTGYLLSKMSILPGWRSSEPVSHSLSLPLCLSVCLSVSVSVSVSLSFSRTHTHTHTHTHTQGQFCNTSLQILIHVYSCSWWKHTQRCICVKLLLKSVI